MRLGTDSHRPTLRHKAAIRRTELSLPVKCLMRDQVLDACESLFDHGCGYGQDVRSLQQLGLDCEGWDRVHQPNTLKCSADAVNLGYVLNGIEDVRERSETLVTRPTCLPRRLSGNPLVSKFRKAILDQLVRDNELQLFQ